MVKHINVAKKGIKKFARGIAMRSIIAAVLAGKVVERKSVIRTANRRIVNVKGNAVIIAVPKQAKPTSAARIRRSKDF